MIGNTIASALLLLATSNAFAALFQVTASGSVETAVDPQGLLPFELPAPGTPVTLSFVFGDSAPDEVTGPNQGRYTAGVSALQLQVGTVTYTLPGGASRIDVFDDCACIVSNVGPQDYYDSWQAVQSYARPGGELEDLVSLALFSGSFLNLPVAPLTSDGLAPPPPLGGWPTALIIYRVEEVEPSRTGRRAEVQANVTSLSVTAVPGPVPLLLLATAMASLALRRRLRLCSVVES